MALSVLRIYSATKNLPNFTLTAEKIVTVNATINSVVASFGLLDDLIYQMGNFSNITSQYPPIFDDVSNNIINLDATVRGVDIFVVVDLLQSLLDLFFTIPDSIIEVYDEAVKVTIVNELNTPALQVFLNQIYSINETLVQVPDDISDFVQDIQDYLNVTDINDRLNDYLDKILDANKTVTGNLSW